MEYINVRYVGANHSQPGSDIVITFQRDDGGRYSVLLAPGDASRLVEEVTEQVRISRETFRH
jgi:hypothetical protein